MKLGGLVHRSDKRGFGIIIGWGLIIGGTYLLFRLFGDSGWIALFGFVGILAIFGLIAKYFADYDKD